MKPLNLTKQLRHLGQLLRPFAKHHYFISTMGVLLSLISAVYIMTQTLDSPTDDEYRTQKESESIRATFDQQTMDKLKQLHISTGPSSHPPNLPPNTRINPFAE